MSRFGLVAAMLIGLCGSAFAQESVLDQRVQSDGRGSAVVWLPDGIGNGMFAWRLAQTAGVPLIFEAVPIGYRDPAIVAERVDLAGKTVREALDLPVTEDSRYQWEERSGVVVIRPISLWTNPDNALNQPAGGRNWDQLSAQDVLIAVMTTIDGGAAPLPVSVDAQPLAIDVQTGTLLDVLVAAAHAHGALMWSVPDGAQGAERAGFSIGFKTFDGRGAGLTAAAPR